MPSTAQTMRELRQSIKLLNLYTYDALHQRIIKTEVLRDEILRMVPTQEKQIFPLELHLTEL
jgi:hypothetical protein